MDEFFNLFMNVLFTLSKADSLTPNEIKAIHKKLDSTYKGLNACGKKLKQAANFVDFFVHDILDYTMLNKDDTNFTKDIKVFDIRLAVTQIIEIQEDKSKMKNIAVKVVYKGF